jgi:hypothetical protein
MRPIRLAVPGMLALLAAAPALGAEGQAPRPGPEHQRLAYFVGKWKAEGTTAANPFMPAGKFTSADTCEWFGGKFAVVCRSSGKAPTGPTKGLAIMSYSPEEKVYLYYGLDNSPMAMATVPRGTVEGDVWTYTDESKMGGQMVKSRYVITASKASYEFRWEVLGPDGQWKELVKGKATRAK